MSVANITDQIDYPESDGKPMGETDLHRDWMIRILEIFRYRYRGERVYTASDLLLYYEEGQPTKFVVPDNFVVLDCEPGRRRVFKTWNEGKIPDVIFEVTSRGTSSVDIIDKPVLRADWSERVFSLRPHEFLPDACATRVSIDKWRIHRDPQAQRSANV